MASPLFNIKKKKIKKKKNNLKKKNINNLGNENKQ